MKKKSFNIAKAVAAALRDHDDCWAWRLLHVDVVGVAFICAIYAFLWKMI